MNASSLNAYGLGASILAVGLLSAAPVMAQRPPPAYNLTTQFRGKGVCLDVYASGPKNNRARMAPCAGSPGQAWLLVRGTGANAGSYHLTTQLRGPDMCLGVIEKGPGANNLGLAKCADTPSQFWTMRTMGGAMKLASTFKGGKCAEVINGGDDNDDIAYAACATSSGQFWAMGIAAAPPAKPAAPAKK
jgi:hypothetical protein